MGDLWAVGVMLYYVLTGKWVVDGAEQKKEILLFRIGGYTQKDLSIVMYPMLSRILHDTLAQDPDERVRRM